MLTNLDWLAEGKLYPPPSEVERIDTYRVNDQLYHSRHPDAWKETYENISRRLKRKHCDVETVLNYQQLLSKKTSDFVCGEPPSLETDGDTDELNRVLSNSQFNTRLYEAFIDVSRFGNAVLKFVGTSVTAVSPMAWFPIVAPDDLKTIQQHVIAYPTKPDADGTTTELYAEIHDIGAVEKRTYKYDSKTCTIGKLVNSEKPPTSIPVSAVQVLTNVTDSSSLYGIDDYAIINSIVSRIMWRLHCADLIMDKHSEPNISGPSSALEKDPRTGLWFVNLGNYFKRDHSEDPELRYVTWDGNLDANFKEIDLLANQLYTLSEMGQAFMEGGGGGDANSGTALKLRMVSPRIKAARLVSLNESCVKTIITVLGQLNGIDVNPDTLVLHWNDGLPEDQVETINTLVTATGGKPIMSQYAAMKRLGLSDADVEDELEEMRTESAARSPIALGVTDPFSGDADNGEENDAAGT